MATTKYKLISTPEERFWNCVDKTPTCWNWTSINRSYGYGYMWDSGKRVQVHRFSYKLHKGEIPTGLTIDHLCRNKLCVNPEHLEAVTVRENTRRADEHLGIRSAATHCKNGHEFTPKNTTYYKGTAVRHAQRFCRECQRNNLFKYRQKMKALSHA